MPRLLSILRISYFLFYIFFLTKTHKTSTQYAHFLGQLSAYVKGRFTLGNMHSDLAKHKTS